MTLNYLPFKTLDYERTAGTCGMELRPTPLFFSFLFTYLLLLKISFLLLRLYGHEHVK